jgi:hypothetical protein
MCTTTTYLLYVPRMYYSTLLLHLAEAFYTEDLIGGAYIRVPLNEAPYLELFTVER